MSSPRSLFISHSSHDKQFARTLANHLEEYGITIWLDEAQLSLGDFLTTTIEHGIAKAEYFAVILSSYSARSEWVQRELEIAQQHEQQRGKTFIIPILLELSALPVEFRDKLYADFTDSDLYPVGFHQFLKLLNYELEPTDKLRIFADSFLKLGWENWSWLCSYDAKSTQYVYSGQYAIRVDLQGTGGLAFAFRSGINTEKYRNLEFYINGGDVGGQSLKVFVFTTGQI